MRRDLILYISLFFTGIWIFMGIGSTILTSEKPVLVISEGKMIFPILDKGNRIDYKSTNHEFALWPPVAFDASKLDLQNTGSRPPGSVQTTTSGNFTHLLGTDHLGRDVLAGLFNGAKVSLLVVSGALAMTSVLGISLGLLMGFYGDKGLMLRINDLLAIVVFFLAVIFHLGLESKALFSLLIWSIAILIFWLMSRMRWGNKFRKQISVPFDLLLSRIIEVFESIPKILLLIAIFAGFLPSINKVIILLAITSWPSITRIVRAETLKEKQKQYITAGITQGFGDSRLILAHILPNISGPVITHLTFTAGAIVLVESALSFLGLGVPPDVVTWGRMLAQAKTQLSAWWLVLFPGFFIFATVFSLNYLGRFLGERFRSESQQKLII